MNSEKTPRRLTILPFWAFEALLKSDIHTMIDQSMDKPILGERSHGLSLVLISKMEWDLLNNARSGQATKAEAVPTADTVSQQDRSRSTV